MKPSTSSTRRREDSVARPGAPESEVIGRSVEGRALVIHYRGKARAGLRILILAGQHGDEPHAREAASAYLADAESDGAPAHLAILANANPDGAAAGTRRNSSGTDLNRDHVLLSAPETSALHTFVDRWRPDLVVDVHTYRPWRPELLQHGFVFPQDVMIDFPTNPAVHLGWPAGTGARLLEFVKHRLAQGSFRCERYTLVRRSGIVRHSNLDIVDARNGLSLRYGVPTVLLEGRRSSPDDPPIFEHPRVALRLAIEAVVEWAARNVGLFRRPGGHSGIDDLVPVRCQYAGSHAPGRLMEMQSASRGDIHVVEIPGAYRPSVRTTGVIRLPKAYGVPRGSMALLSVLATQRFETADPNQFRHLRAEVCRTPHFFLADAMEARLTAIFERVPLDAERLVLFPTNQLGGRSLALLLDPESQFGVHRFSKLGLSPDHGNAHPVARVL